MMVAMTNLNDGQFGHRMHEAEKAFPGIHQDPDMYNVEGEKSYRDIKKTRGKPETSVTVYKPVSKGDKSGISHGDTVTTDKEYADRNLSRSLPNNDYRIIRGKAQAQDLHTRGEDPNEWNYRPTQK